MAYIPTVWTPGKRITSDDLNKIEQELVRLNEENLKLHKRLNEIESLGSAITTEALEELGAVMYNHQLDINAVDVENLPEHIEDNG